jgi:hypothetical protein
VIEIGRPHAGGDRVPGRDAAALEGGYRAWREKFPVEEKEGTKT